MASLQSETKQEIQKQIAAMRHIVRLDENGQPLDVCLCGHIWDQLHVKPNGTICEECVRIAKMFL